MVNTRTAEAITLPVMARTATEEVLAWVSFKIRQELNEGKTLREIADAVGGSHPTVMRLEKRRQKSIDSDWLEAFAKHYNTGGVPGVYRLAAIWSAEHSEAFETPAPVRTVEYDVRYSNFELAALVAIREGVPPDIIDIVRSDAMKMGEDLTPTEWLVEIRRAQRLNRPIVTASQPESAPAAGESLRERSARLKKKEDKPE